MNTYVCTNSITHIYPHLYDPILPRIEYDTNVRAYYASSYTHKNSQHISVKRLMCWYTPILPHIICVCHIICDVNVEHTLDLYTSTNARHVRLNIHIYLCVLMIPHILLI